jgi:GntR family transcriptional regulator of arabinose operon
MYTSLSLRLRIPEQLSITGFSDGKLSSMLPIPLTTVKQPTDQLAFSAVRLLIKRIDHSREAVLTIKIHTSLVERHTVATIIPS